MPASYANHRAQLKAILLGWGMPEENAEITRDSGEAIWFVAYTNVTEVYESRDRGRQNPGRNFAALFKRTDRARRAFGYGERLSGAT